MKKARNNTKMSVMIAALLFAAGSARADVATSGIFTDHMVLQRDIPVAVFGSAEPGESVTVAFAGQSKATTAGKDGQWSVKLEAMKASADWRKVSDLFPQAWKITRISRRNSPPWIGPKIFTPSGMSARRFTTAQTSRTR